MPRKERFESKLHRGIFALSSISALIAGNAAIVYISIEIAKARFAATGIFEGSHFGYASIAVLVYTAIAFECIRRLKHKKADK